LRSLARGGTFSDHEYGRDLSVDSFGLITEGDLSGGGGVPTDRANQRDNFSFPQTASRLGAQSLVQLLGEQLQQAEQRLADEHQRVLGLVGQLLEERPQTAAKAATSLHAAAFVPASAVFPAAAAWRSWENPPSLLEAATREQSLVSLSQGVPRPSAHPGAAVPMPNTDAPRMVVPGQVEEEGKEEYQDNMVTGDPTKVERFYLHEVYKKVSKKRREQPAGGHMLSAAALKRASKIEIYEDEQMAAQQQNLSEGCCRHFILNPNNVIRSVWDIMSMLLVLYDMIMVPFGFFEPEDTVGMTTMEWVTRLFWTADIPMSFVSGFVTSDGTIEMRPGPIAKKYGKSWCVLDIAVVGADWTEIILGKAMEGMDMARMSKVSRIFRILRMIRLLRLAKVGEIVSLLAERLPSEKLVVFIDILKLIIIMLGIGHMLACIWYIIGKELGPANRVDWNWLDKFEFTNEPLEYRYIMSLRWALSQFAGGMDEVTPVSLAEHIYAGCVYIGAFWSGTVFLSILTSHFTQLYILGNQQSQQLNVMRRYLAQNGISKGLVLRVTRNAQHTMKMRQRATPEAAVGLLDLVSEPLRIELHYEMYYPMLGLHPFFAEYMKACPFVVRKICHAAMSTNTYSRDDVIFHFGEASSKMQIVRSGLLTYSWAASSEQLSEGRWLSEAALWTDWVHRGVLTAIEDSIVFAVNAQMFQNIVGMFELSVFDPCDYACRFVRALNNASAEDLTDLPLRTLARHRASRASMMWRNTQGSQQSEGFMDTESILSSDSLEEEPAAAPGKLTALGAPGRSRPTSAASRRNPPSKATQISSAHMHKRQELSISPLQERISGMWGHEDYFRRMRLEDLVNEEEV